MLKMMRETKKPNLRTRGVKRTPGGGSRSPCDMKCLFESRLVPCVRWVCGGSESKCDSPGIGVY